MTATYKWYEFYKSAVLETDWSKMEERIRAAEGAIRERERTQSGPWRHPRGAGSHCRRFAESGRSEVGCRFVVRTELKTSGLNNLAKTIRLGVETAVRLIKWPTGAAPFSPPLINEGPSPSRAVASKTIPSCTGFSVLTLHRRYSIFVGAEFRVCPKPKQ